MISPARRLAFDILLRVETQSAYAGDLLHALSAGMDSRDAGLASEIVLGTLRRRMELDFLIGQAAGRPPQKLDAEVRIALRMGLYQLRHLDRVPAHAAVAESVELVKRARKASAAGFANAVLRKAPRGQVDFPSDAERLSIPVWLLERWIGRWGGEAALAIAAEGLKPAESHVRETRIQNIGSQSVVPLLKLEAGQSFLDLCAAPGNKTIQAMESGVRVIACDRHAHRLRAMGDIGCPRVALDATAPLPFSTAFDRILVDAPCSGTGTLGRNPEIKWRLKPEDLADLHGRQVKILRHALQCLEPGGRLVYSTCSLEREENEDVVAEAAAGWDVQMSQRLPGRDEGDGFFAAIICGEREGSK